MLRMVVRWKLSDLDSVPGSDVAVGPHFEGNMFVPMFQDLVGACIGQLKQAGMYSSLQED